jgi:arginine decarboxylase
VSVPDRYLLVCGAGDADEVLNAFDRALYRSGAGDFNLVKVTSILPPSAQKGAISELPPGGIVFAALGSDTSDTPGYLISASVAVGVSADPTEPGVIMEGHFNCSKEEAEKKVRRMAHQALVDRGSEILRIESVSVEHRVVRSGSVLAAVLLWNSK